MLMQLLPTAHQPPSISNSFHLFHSSSPTLLSSCVDTIFSIRLGAQQRLRIHFLCIFRNGTGVSNGRPVYTVLKPRFHLEHAVVSLSEGLQEANAARQYAEAVEEEGESSFEDLDRVRPVRLDCKVCERELANVMVWSCRHVCVCKRCDAALFAGW
ncbi:hypothetical protein SASPL_130769 [Salvia splendens]|uniref:Uncharacterized protein n=1 Tax=Salvia splendens TaxID=180675 RepID=A0A8X8ZK94_SALSN|nr:hypothetical protein SASPL_130769 [Salvia splendens]